MTEEPPAKLKALASIVTRAASDQGSSVVVSTGWFSEPERYGLVERSVTSKLGQLRLLVAARSEHLGVLVELGRDDEPLIGAHNGSELRALAHALVDAGSLSLSTRTDGPPLHALTAKGWEEVERLERPGQGRQVFVAMWFDPSMNESWSTGFEPGIRATGLEPLRIDKKEHINKIDDEIIVEIRKSRAVIADVTGQRAGVYFEAGFALGLKLPVIWCCQEDDMKNVHFDTRQFNHIVWKTPADLREQLERRLRAVLDLP